MTFVEMAREKLLASRLNNVAWSYRRGGEPAVEPTFLATVALLATNPDDLIYERGSLQPVGDWLAGLQQPDGSVGVTPSLPRPGWPTALAILLWAALKAHPDCRTKAVSWLLIQKGQTSENDPQDPVAHDHTIAGWPWVDKTHSWIEPTAWAILALRREWKLDSPRLDDGIRMLVDRAIPTGGWNYGNRIVFNTNLRPQVGPTGLALLSLAGLETPPPAIVEPSLSYLAKESLTIRAPQSLCWAIAGLSAWNRRPAATHDWVEASFNTFLSAKKNRPAPDDAATLLAYLLMAWSESTCQLLGVPSGRNEKTK